MLSTLRTRGLAWHAVGMTEPNSQDLRTHYGRLSDEELQSIASIDAENLTPEARQALSNELARRRLRTATALPQPVAEVIRPSTTTGEWRYPKARLGARFLAYIIDMLVASVPPILIIALGFVLSPHRGFSPLAAIAILASIAWVLYYSFTKDGWRGGQSIGKKAVDLMVVDVRTNLPCTMGESALRALILFLLNLIPGLGWLVEPIVVLASENGRRLGDLVAGTQVIDTSSYSA
jgi:uncharacterized RDD family membrane protein YckC